MPTMKYRHLISSLGPLCLAALTLFGCSADQVGAEGTGGMPGSGGGQSAGGGGSSGVVGSGGTGGGGGKVVSGGAGGNGGTGGGSAGTSGGSGTGGTSGAVGAGSGGMITGGGAGVGAGGGAGLAAGGAEAGGAAGGIAAGSGGHEDGGSGGRGAAGAGAAGAAGTGMAGSAGAPPIGTEPNSVAYIGCSMAYNIGTGYKRVGGKVMWNSDSYQTSAMVVQNWTSTSSSSWNLFDQKLDSIGGKDKVKAVMVQICIFSSRATDDEIKQMVASAKMHTNPGTHIYLVGQPQYEAGHECSLAGNGGAKWTDDEAKKIAADSSVGPDVSYLGTFIIDSTKGQVSSDSCHATSSGEDELGKQAMAFFGG